MNASKAFLTVYHGNISKLLSLLWPNQRYTMSPSFRPFIAPAGGALFAALFYHESIGINLFLFEVPLFVWLFYQHRRLFSRALFTLSSILWACSLFTVILVHSHLALVSHIVIVAFWVGTATTFSYQYTHFAWIQGIQAFPDSVASAWKQRTAERQPGLHILPRRRYAWFFIVPLMLLAIFFSLYTGSNPMFDRITERSFDLLQRSFEQLWMLLNFQVLLLFLAGTLITIWLVTRQVSQRWVSKDSAAPVALSRTKWNAKHGDDTKLRLWIRSTTLALVLLNALLLLVNFTDIWYVLFEFQWQGQYLTSFVHQSTWLLIVSILLSASILLYIFRGSMHWYTRNKRLKVLAYTWMVQNAILTLSVLVRNIIYIQHFSLAYKRIAVIVFLGLVLFGLFTVWVKISRKQSIAFVVHRNVAALLVALSVTSCVNWDVLIARYNLSKGGQAFVHLDFLATLSDAALPDLHIAQDQLYQWQNFQNQTYRLSEDFMSPEVYLSIIASREADFIQQYQNKSWLSWNLPDYLAYRRLTGY